MRVMLGQISPVVGDVLGNLARCRQAVVAARDAGCRLLVLPELVLSGYPPRDLLDRADLIEACRIAARTLAAESRDALIVVFGAPVRDERGLRNAALVAFGGEIVAVVHKSLLPTYDVFDEARHFVAGDEPRLVEVGGIWLGVTICEDLWNDPSIFGGRDYSVDPVLALVGADVIVNLSASPFHAGKGDTRLELLRRQTARAGAPILLCNQVGGNDEILFDGDSLAVSADGQLLAQGRAFEEDLLIVETEGPVIAPRELDFSDEVRRALVMGIRDYAGRCGFRTAVLGLSGGIDSAVVAALATEALGPDRVHGVGMPGPFSSEGSVADAEALARNLGIRFDVVPITGLYASYLSALAPLFGDRARDVTEENLQARARGTVLMALSNKFGHLLLSTGNKSELAVGYCTLYGDMNGGLAAIGDVYKTDVYRLARFINRYQELIPVSTLEKPPSAELAPNQKDQDSLPPYDVLDGILRSYIEEARSPEAIVEAGYDPATVRRVVRLVVGSEYKRWQAPPVLRVSHKAFGMGRRLPLAQRWHSGGAGLRDME